MEIGRGENFSVFDLRNIYFEKDIVMTRIGYLLKTNTKRFHAD